MFLDHQTSGPGGDLLEGPGRGQFEHVFRSAICKQVTKQITSHPLKTPMTSLLISALLGRLHTVTSPSTTQGVVIG